MPRKMPKIPCKRPAPPPPPATLREYEKSRSEVEYPVHVPAHYSSKFPTCDYNRCVIWASDPKVLQKYLIENGKFTVKKLMRKSLFGPLMFTDSDYHLFLPKFKSEMERRTPVLFSEIIDDNTILLLTRSTLLTKILSYLLRESPEYDVINVPIPLNLIWHHRAERYTNCLGDQQDEHYSYGCDVHYSFKDASISFTGDYKNVKRLYDMVMEY